MKIYDTEEEQIAAIKLWWAQNARSTIVSIIAGIMAVSAWNYWQTSEQDVASESAMLFDKLLASIDNKQAQTASDMVSQLAAQNTGSMYANLGSLFLAKSKIEQGDLATGASILQGLLSETLSDEIQNIARIRLIIVRQAQNEHDQALQLIAQANPATTHEFAAIYDELTGDSYTALGRHNAARTAYKSASRGKTPSPLLRLKLNDTTANPS